MLLLPLGALKRQLCSVNHESFQRIVLFICHSSHSLWWDKNFSFPSHARQRLRWKFSENLKYLISQPEMHIREHDELLPSCLLLGFRHSHSDTSSKANETSGNESKRCIRDCCSMILMYLSSLGSAPFILCLCHKTCNRS